ncbi:MAG: hypothetical protein NXI24_11510 [bacterium]|nr:hypothetical protein [bacterium]
MNNLAEARTQTIADRDLNWHSIGDAANFPINAGIAVKVDDRQIAVYRFRAIGQDSEAPVDEWYACDNTCPQKNDNVLASRCLWQRSRRPVHITNIILRRIIFDFQASKGCYNLRLRKTT